MMIRAHRLWMCSMFWQMNSISFLSIRDVSTDKRASVCASKGVVQKGGAGLLPTKSNGVEESYRTLSKMYTCSSMTKKAVRTAGQNKQSYQQVSTHR